jgi:predicted nuclease with RNAse H fold
LIQFVLDKRPNVIAIDAPSKRNCGLMRQTHVRREVLGTRSGERTRAGRALYEDCRVSEAELGVRNIKSYFTSGVRSPPDWVGAGLRLYDELASLGYMPWDEPGSVSTLGSGIDQIVVETYPHACFVVKLGWIPQLKTSLGGCLERIACLKAWGDELGLELGASDGILREIGELSWARIVEQGAPRSVSHDKLDALAAALTAKVVANDPAVAYAVGRKADGVIVLPGRPAAAYHAR